MKLIKQHITEKNEITQKQGNHQSSTTNKTKCKTIEKNIKNYAESLEQQIKHLILPRMKKITELNFHPRFQRNTRNIMKTD